MGCEFYIGIQDFFLLRFGQNWWMGQVLLKLLKGPITFLGPSKIFPPMKQLKKWFTTVS